MKFRSDYNKTIRDASWTSWSPLSVQASAGTVTSHNVEYCIYKDLGPIRRYLAAVRIIIAGSAAGSLILNVPFAAKPGHVFTGIGREMVLTGHTLTTTFIGGTLHILKFDNTSPIVDGAYLSVGGFLEL